MPTSSRRKTRQGASLKRVAPQDRVDANDTADNAGDDVSNDIRSASDEEEGSERLLERRRSEKKRRRRNNDGGKEDEEDQGGSDGNEDGNGSNHEAPAADDEGGEGGENNMEDEDDDVDDGSNDNSAPGRSRDSSHQKSGADRRAVPTTPLRERHVNPFGKPAEAGIIHKVYVENFMCHKKLTVELCRNVNFIHGQNGSGKSAILAAVQVCLGAGARRTHRARNLKDMVRKESGADCAGAKLRVTLLNRGDDGYMHDVYGDYITVERSISLRSGGYNGYKLLDADGKERSRSKKDLDAMLDQLNIQVENPVAVLDQEEAKKFLTGKAEDKYEFFSKATELERLDRTYAGTTDKIYEMEENKTRTQESLRGSAENARRLKKEWEQFQELDKLEAEKQEHAAMGMWAVHRELAEVLAEEARKAQKLQQKLTKKRTELVEAEKNANVTDDEEARLKDELEELTSEANGATKAKSCLELDFKRATVPLKQKEREKEVLHRESTQAKKLAKAAQRRLDHARKQIMEAEGNAAEEERNRTRKIAKTEKDLAVAKEQIEPLKDEIGTHLRRYQELEPALVQTKENRAGTERQFQAVKRKVEDLKAESGDGSLAAFGPKCKAVHDRVQKALRAKKFRGPVVGPVGMYVKVEDGKEQYAPIAEFAIGPGNFDRFVVTCMEDLELMKTIRREVKCGLRDCQLYKIHHDAAERKYNTPDPPEGVETVTSVLRVENAMAFNYLVDACRIDELALADSKESSEEALLVRDNNGRESIRGKVKKVYFLPNGDFWEAKGGNRMMVSNEKQLRRTVGVDRSAAINTAKLEGQTLEKELVQNRMQEESVKKDAHKSKKLWNEQIKKHVKLQQTIESMGSTLDKLREEAETSEGVPTIDTSEFEDDVRAALEATENFKGRETTIAQEIEALKPGIEDTKRQLEETTARNEKVLVDLGRVEDKIEDIVKGHARRFEVVEKLKDRIKDGESNLKQQEERVEEKTVNVGNALLSARQVVLQNLRDKKRKDGNGVEGDYDGIDYNESHEDLEAIEVVDPPKDSKYYEKKAAAKHKLIEKERERRNMCEIDPGVAKDKYIRAKRDLDAKVSQIRAIESNVENLKTDLKHRRKRWRQFRAHIARMTTLNFDEFLNKKGMSGELELDHDNRVLNLVVQKDNAHEQSQTKDVKALSGGERSFTTLSLLLAIGESLETPFRVMDEFDVFLDPVARKIALKTLVKTAKLMEHRQFIFITPQDVSSMQTDPKLKIFKMRAPARSNGQIGGPQQQTLD